MTWELSYTSIYDVVSTQNYKVSPTPFIIVSNTKGGVYYWWLSGLNPQSHQTETWRDCRIKDGQSSSKVGLYHKKSFERPNG